MKAWLSKIVPQCELVMALWIRMLPLLHHQVAHTALAF